MATRSGVLSDLESAYHKAQRALQRAEDEGADVGSLADEANLAYAALDDARQEYAS